MTRFRFVVIVEREYGTSGDIMPTEMLLKYPVALLTAFLVTYMFTPPVIRLASRAGLIDRPGERRIHMRPTPRGGGLAVFLGIHAACAVVILPPWSTFVGTIDAAWWRHFASLSTLMFLLGLADDKWGVRAPVKLAAQAAIALAAYSLGMRAGNAFGFHLPLPVDAAVSVFWFLAIVNAFNLIDGIDGLATGLGATAGLGLAGWLALRRMPGDVLIALGLAGACLGFLRYNFHPARCFLGDCGSLSIGFAVAAISLSTGSKGTTVAAVGVPLLAVGVPLFDTLLAVWRRAVAGFLRRGEGAPAGIMRADMDHLHHRLVKSGLSQGTVAWRLYLASACLIAVGLLSMLFHAKAMAIYVITFVTVAYVVINHLARSEIRASGQAVLEGLRRPAKPIVMATLHPLADAAWLAASFSAALFLTRPSWGLEEYKLTWFAQIPFWVGIPLLVFAASGVYSQVWSRARPADYTKLSATLLLALLLALGLTGLAPDANPRTLFVRWLAVLGLAQLGITVRRAVPQSAMDMTAMTLLHDSPAPDCHDVQLIYGAGRAGSLYLDFLSPDKARRQNLPHVVGFIDDSPFMAGRIVRGLKVLGGIESVETLVASNKVRSIVVAAGLTPEHEAQLAEIAGRTGVSAVRWRAALEPIAGRNM